MLLKDFYNSHRNEAKEIDVKDIVLTEKCHINGMNKKDIFSLKCHSPCAIVAPYKSKYRLVTGWKSYTVAIRDNIKSISAIILREEYSDFTRNDFIRYVAHFQRMDISDIIISKSFSATTPHTDKIKIAENGIALNKNYLLNHPIVVNNDNVLVDGYAKYLACMNLSINTVPVIRAVYQKRNKKYKITT